MTSEAKAAYTLYHNPRCSKSRATLELLAKQGIQPRIVEYLRTPLSVEELTSLSAKLKLKPSEFVRENEEAYKALFASGSPSEAELIAAMAEHPVLIERPILEKGARAIIGRPPENVLQLLK